jgi:hypothetical protein
MYQPDYQQWINQAWGWPQDSLALLPMFSGASNIVIGTNPPYSAADFLALYPKFLGPATAVTAATTSESNAVTLSAAVTGLAKGQLVNGDPLQSGTTFASVAGTAAVLSLPATATATAASLSAYTAPLIPLPVLNAYIYLATSSIIQARWVEGWENAMGLFIAHYATLWLQGEANPLASTNATIAATSGLASGIMVSKSADGLSASYQPIQGLEDWGAFNLTRYGQLFATLAAGAGAGPMLLY